MSAVIDLHSHILPYIDDGAKDMATSVAMAKIAVADGTTHIACTPHIVPGIYDNNNTIITQAVNEFNAVLSSGEIELELVIGADIHIAPDIIGKLADGLLPKLGDSRYFLFEPTHNILPPGIVLLCKKIIENGFSPILTHPERLTWIESHYDIICELDDLGVAIQLTAMSVTGNFGKRAKYWSDRMLEEGRVDIIASDAHNTNSRPPGLSKARDVIVGKLGEREAHKMVKDNPAKILANLPIAKKQPKKRVKKESYWRKILNRN